MPIGKLVKSNSHTDYVCQIYGSAEVATPPAPQDYAFGTFVRMPLDGQGGHLVGVIYDTILVNPDFGNLGPRLSPTSDLAVFSPDYLAEKVTLVGITALGLVGTDGIGRQGVPPLTAGIDALVEPMAEDAVRAFHAVPGGGVVLTYAPLLLAQARPLTHHLLMNILGQLRPLFPGSAAQLDVLSQELSWRAHVGPLGGER